MKTKTHKTNRKSRRGAAAVEAALMLPFLIIVSFLAIDISQYINAAQVIANSSREGARLAAKDGTSNVSEVETAVKNYLTETLPNLGQEEMDELLTISVKHVVDDEEENISSGDLSSISSGEKLNVQISMDFSAIRWLKGPSYRAIGSTTFCRRQ